jgi:DNA-binding SARP family transcriptional activator
VISSSGGRVPEDRRLSDPDPPAVHVVRLFLLDGFRLTVDGVPAELPHGLQRVVALAALRPGATRSHLAGLLWPETPDERALSCLRTALWRLRRQAPGTVVAAGDAVRLDAAVDVDVDELVRSAARVRDGDDPRTTDGILAAGRHDLLPGWYDDWVTLERERLRQLRLHALEEIARAQLRLGRHGEALQAALEAARAEPLRETPHRLIVEVHLAEGNAYEALHAFYTYRDLVLRDLQLEPSAAMSALLSHILKPIGRPAASSAAWRPGPRQPADHTDRHPPAGPCPRDRVR